jgi:eukaryotic-like serine/threonine-protein kinase
VQHGADTLARVEAQRFGRYTVTGTLGRGAMGHVYAAVDDVLGRPVAVKTLHGTATGLDARQLDERFRLEARAVAALNHPNIVQVYDLDLAAQPPYLVMERMTGPSLRERFEAGALPENELRALGIQIARALAAAHAAGIVHRDVKPANILIAGPGAWKLADFGVAHVPDSSLTMTGQFIGSPAYAPPESLLRGQSTAAGDVFGLGATLYYGAAGRWPRAEATDKALLAPIPSLRTLVPHLANDLIAIIDAAVQLDPDRRPTAEQLAEALGGAPRTSSPVVTEFVPDHTSYGARPTASPPAGVETVPLVVQTVPPSPPSQTAFVADSTPGLPHAPAPVRALRWRPWAALGGVVLVIGIIAATRSGSSPDQPMPGSANTERPATTPASPADSTLEDVAPEDELELPPPGEIRAISPAFGDRRAAHDWNKVIEELYKQKFDRARKKLDEWERRWGETAETRHLRKQLDRLPATED